MPESNDHTPPKAGVGNAAQAIVRSCLGAIPIAGAGATELFNAIVTPVLERRRNQWMERVGEALRRLEDNRGINLEELRNNDIFIDIVMQASQSAVRNSQEDKQKALRNAVLNSALPYPPEDALQQMFINFIDTFTRWHIKILKFLADPPSGGINLQGDYPIIHQTSLNYSLEDTFPELKGRQPFYDQILHDLSLRGLINLSAMDTSHEMATTGGILSIQIKDLGKQLMDFITSPIEDEEGYI